MGNGFIRRVLAAPLRRFRSYCPERLLLIAFIVLGLPSYLRARLRGRGPYLRERWPGRDPMESARRVAVFVHFDPQGRIHDWLVHYLSEIRRSGFRIVFVSNSPKLSEHDVSRVRSHCAIVLRRDNIGYDFGAYKDGIGCIPDLGSLDCLLLANDSVFGPFHPLSDIVAGMSPERASVWGMTDSEEGRYHLQSYFLLIHRAALQNPAFAAFWRDHRYVQSRYWNILKYELGLTRALLNSGLSCQALFPYRQAVANSKRRAVGAPMDSDAATGEPNAAANPTHDLWDVLIGELGCPFIKRDLLRNNPAGDPDLGRWRTLVESVSGYDTGIIVDEGHGP